MKPSSSGSAKTPVIKKIFFDRWDDETKTLSDPVVTRDDLRHAVEDLDAKLSTGNFANFFKDIVRRSNRNNYFPPEVVSKGYTARQYPSKSRGEHRIFLFEPLPKHQTTAFVNLEPPPALLDEPQYIQSVSLDPATRMLGRRDESWLTTVLVELHVLHTHLARESTLPVIGAKLLMTNVKLGNAEVDALYSVALDLGDAQPDTAIASMENKSSKEVLEEEQILRGAEAAQNEATKKLGIPEATVIPMGAKVVGDTLIWIVEFSTAFPPLSIASQQVYELVPGTPGIR
jgi:hypothetical protein